MAQVKKSNTKKIVWAVIAVILVVEPVLIAATVRIVAAEPGNTPDNAQTKFPKP